MGEVGHDGARLGTRSILFPDLISRSDPIYDAHADQYQARSNRAKWFYIFMHLAPGLFAIAILNIEFVYLFLRDSTGLQDRSFQFLLFVVVTYGWHIVIPLIVLMKSDGLSLRETLSFLGFTRFDWKGCFVILPLMMVPFTLACVPYYMWIAPPMEAWLMSIPAFQIPEYSIFGGDLYDFPIGMLLVLFIGNFLGEELYYRGYLMKKCAFLGRHTWWITSLLFAIYHFWQIPQTWPSILPVLIFGYMMMLRKDIYVVILLHLFLNVAWFSIVDAIIDAVS